MDKDQILKIDAFSSALKDLSTAVLTQGNAAILNGENFAWNIPTLNRIDLAQMADSLSHEIKEYTSTLNQVEKEYLRRIELFTQRVKFIQANTVPQIIANNTNTPFAISAYISSLQAIRTICLPNTAWILVQDSKVLPSHILKSTRAAEAELNQLIPEITTFNDKIKIINSAHDAAENLPIDLESLNKARTEINDSLILINTAKTNIKTASDNANTEFSNIQKKVIEINKLAEQCGEAYSITTTKGLAGAFDLRAVNLTNSMWIWVFGLALSLISGAILGAHRLDALTTALQASQPNWGSIVIQTTFSIVAVGAPLWFAWLSTKQIGQRFRLAEDYAFKATVAKAYEGYRREASRIDPAFEKQLFGSALTRLEEAPLRLVENNSHGSPWHEIANSDAVQKVFNAVPDLQEKLTNLLREVANLASGDQLVSGDQMDVSKATTKNQTQ